MARRKLTPEQKALAQFIGARIRGLRERARMSQAEVSGAVVKSRPYASNWENVHDLPGRDTLARLAELFKVPLDHFNPAACARVAPGPSDLAPSLSEDAVLGFWRNLPNKDRAQLLLKMLNSPAGAEPPRSNRRLKR
jgi:transcriptional regulator with XRE-family HTH domain